MHTPEPQLPAGAYCSRNCEGRVIGERHWRSVILFMLAIVAVFATRLPYLPSFLEDLDSVNFDLGVHDFNPFLHQPHPPGFPVFIAVAKGAHALVDNHATALALVSAMSSAAAVVPLYILSWRLAGGAAAITATVMLLFNPLVWLNSVRPMSDVTGFSAVVTAQVVLLLAHRELIEERRSAFLWMLGAVLAGLAIGIRIQNAILVTPVILVILIVERRPKLWIGALGGLTAASISWIIPTIIESGGIHRYWARLQLMLAVAWPSEPLASRPSWERLREGLTDVFLLPWGEMWMAWPVLLLAAIGYRMMWRRQRPVLNLLLILFAPYALYHLFFQETATLRYSIPVLPLVVLPAAFAMTSIQLRSVVPVALAALLAVLTIPTLNAYARTPSPPFQAIQSLERMSFIERPVVTGDHVFERYLPLSAASRIIRPRPQQEWRALNRYWVAGGHGPVWYFRDPARSVLNLSDVSAQRRVDAHRWPKKVQTLLKGTRPSEVELIRLTPPRWFAESGFLLTPDAGPPDRVANEPHLFFVSRRHKSDRVLISGTTAQPTALTIVMEGRRQKWSVSHNFTVQATVHASQGHRDGYMPIRLEAGAPLLLTSLAIAAEDDDVLGPVRGLYAPERDDDDSEFRWAEPDAGILLSRSGAAVRLTLRGRIPEHLKLPVSVRSQIDDHTTIEHTVTEPDFSVSWHLDATDKQTSLVRVSTSQSFVPDQVERNGDTRRLAFRVYGLELTRAKPPGR